MLSSGTIQRSAELLPGHLVNRDPLTGSERTSRVPDYPLFLRTAHRFSHDFDDMLVGIARQCEPLKIRANDSAPSPRLFRDELFSLTPVQLAGLTDPAWSTDTLPHSRALARDSPPHLRCSHFAQNQI